MIGGWVVFVCGCVAFCVGGAYMVYRSVHRNDSRLARWVLPAVEDPVRSPHSARALCSVTFPKPGLLIVLFYLINPLLMELQLKLT